MVHFVLNANREEPFSILNSFLAIVIKILNAAPRWALHILKIFRHRKTAFLVYTDII